MTAGPSSGTRQSRERGPRACRSGGEWPWLPVTIAGMPFGRNCHAGSGEVPQWLLIACGAPARALGGAGLEHVVDGANLRLNLTACLRQRVGCVEVLALLHRCACFLHRRRRPRRRGGESVEVLCRDASCLGGLDASVELPERVGRGSQRRLGVVVSGGLAVGGAARLPGRARWRRWRGRARADSRADRPLRAPAAAPTLPRRTPRRVLVGTRRARRIDRALGAIDFFLRRFGAPAGEQEHHDQDATDDASPGKYSRVWCTMKTVAPHDRPREKLRARLAPPGLGDNELLAIVLGHGRARAERARSRQRGARRGWRRARPGPGAGTTTCAQSPASARRGRAQMLAAVELGRRTLTRGGRERRADHEPAWRRRVPAAAVSATVRSSSSVSCCSIRSTACCGRSCCRSARSTPASSIRARCSRGGGRAGAAALVLFHNHPSGDPKPSDDDVELTRRLVRRRRADGDRRDRPRHPGRRAVFQLSRERERSSVAKTLLFRLLFRRLRRHGARRAAGSRHAD